MTGTDRRNAGSGHHLERKDAGVHHYTDDEMHNLDVAHEARDVNVRGVLLFAVALVGVTVVATVVVLGLFHFFESEAAARDPLLSPLAAPATEMPARTTGSPFFGGAPQPRLITNEPAALGLLHKKEDQRLHGYGWVDENAKVAHIPIEEAKKRILERGLPARTGAVPSWLGTNAPAYGESSSGRAIHGSKEPSGSKDPGAAKREQR
jgi:hypothetical protein